MSPPPSARSTGSSGGPIPALESTPATRRGPALFVAWISLLTLVAALLASDPVIENWIRPAFFGALVIFFLGLGGRSPELRSLPWRLIEIGFLLLTLGSACAIVLRSIELPFGSVAFRENLAFGLDRGVGFLLGMASLGYGIVLWVPEILESRQRARQRLQQANVVLERQDALVNVGELAAGVAHELRNPLAIVKSALQRMRSDALDEEESSRCLEVMERAVEKADARIAGLLDLGRITDFDPELVGARRFLDDVASLVRPQAMQHEVRIDVDAADDTTFWGDRELLLQVLLNLVRNSLQATPHRGPIRLAAVRSENGATRLVVEDSGCGLAADECARVFEPFFTTKRDGNGLGLSICARLVDRHDGRITLRPRDGGGSRAVVELPSQRTIEEHCHA